MQLEHTINDIDLTINASEIQIDYDDGGRLHRVTLTHDQFKQIWRLLAHYNQIVEAEKCEK